MSLPLTKGQRLPLKKGDNTALVKICAALGWDITPSAGRVDLDANFSTFDKNKNLLENIYFGNKNGCAGAVAHGGDNLTGAGDGDDETIQIDLSKLPANVEHAFVTVTSYTGQKFTVVEKAFVRIYDATKPADELCRFDLTDKFPNTAIIMARIYRHNGEWKIHALGVPADGAKVTDITRAMVAQIP